MTSYSPSPGEDSSSEQELLPGAEKYLDHEPTPASRIYRNIIGFNDWRTGVKRPKYKPNKRANKELLRNKEYASMQNKKRKRMDEEEKEKKDFLRNPRVSKTPEPKKPKQPKQPKPEWAKYNKTLFEELKDLTSKISKQKIDDDDPRSPQFGENFLGGIPDYTEGIYFNHLKLIIPDLFNMLKMNGVYHMNENTGREYCDSVDENFGQYSGLFAFFVKTVLIDFHSEWWFKYDRFKELKEYLDNTEFSPEEEIDVIYEQVMKLKNALSKFEYPVLTQHKVLGRGEGYINYLRKSVPGIIRRYPVFQKLKGYTFPSRFGTKQFNRKKHKKKHKDKKTHHVNGKIDKIDKREKRKKTKKNKKKK